MELGDTKKAEDTLLLAAASTPALGKAFKQRTTALERKTEPTALSNENEQGGQECGSPHGESGIMSYDFERQPRPQTTKCGDRRFTQQPFATIGLEQDPSEFEWGPRVAREVYEKTRFCSPLQRRQQQEARQQQSTCARLSVPHERRRRERWVPRN